MSFWVSEFERLDGELYHQKGRECWLVGQKVTVNKRRGKPFGVINEDSMDPEKMVWVSVHDKDKWIHMDEPKKKKKRRKRCPASTR